MKIATFDLSLTETGYARANGDRREVGTITTSLRGMPRLEHIRSRVLELARRADLVVVEGYSFGAKGRAVVSLGELGGVVRLALHSAGVRYVEVPPATLKKYATGKGNAPKEAMLAAAIRRLDYAGSNHNEADALWLLHAGLDVYGAAWAKLPTAQIEALQAVEWPELTTSAGATFAPVALT